MSNTSVSKKDNIPSYKQVAQNVWNELFRDGKITHTTGVGSVSYSVQAADLRRELKEAGFSQNKIDKVCPQVSGSVGLGGGVGGWGAASYTSPVDVLENQMRGYLDVNNNTLMEPSEIRDN